MKRKPFAELRHHKSKRDRLAEMLGMNVARNTSEDGLYLFSYGSYYMLRVYKPTMRGLKPLKIYEERVNPKTFPTDETIAKLMLLAR